LGEQKKESNSDNADENIEEINEDKKGDII